MPATERYDKMIDDVSKELAELLEDSALRFAWNATPISIEGWTTRIKRDVTSLVADILLEESRRVARIEEKRLNTAKEFAINSVIFNDREPVLPLLSFTEFALDSLIAYFFAKPRPQKADYTRRVM